MVHAGEAQRAGFMTGSLSIELAVHWVWLVLEQQSQQLCGMLCFPAKAAALDCLAFSFFPKVENVNRNSY